MTQARISLDPAFRIGDVSRRLFGSFVEHMGRCVYEGIFEPGHPMADEEGLRQDVVALVQELGATLVRYPGGNFVSGYRWEDGVGPRENRPRRLDLAWRTIETNQFGISEFMQWVRKTGVEPMMAINLGTRGVQEALDLLEYCNHPGGTALSDLRAAHGDAEPYGIKLWCLGNELDGKWQVGHKTATEYGRLAAEAGRAMKLMDPTIELVACGSSKLSMETFGTWEQTVLREAYEEVDYISLHAYYEEYEGDVESFLASAIDMDRAIESVAATADAIRAEVGSEKQMMLSFDEWNVWYKERHNTSAEGAGRTEWVEHPRVIEDEYNVTDAVVVGTLLNSLLRHGDRVAIACQAQLVNVIAPIRAERGTPAWRQTIFFPFAEMASLARGSVLRLETEAASYSSSRFGLVPLVDACATWDEDRGDLNVFVAHRGLDESVDLEIDLRSFGGMSSSLTLQSARTLTIPDRGDRLTCNTQHVPDRVGMRPMDKASLSDDRLIAELPPLSWTVLSLTMGDSWSVAIEVTA